MYRILGPAGTCLLLSAGSSLALSLDMSNKTSVTSAAKTIADSIMSTYNGTESGQIPGIFTGPYYWWESGLVWDGLVNYWALTGDGSYNDIVNQALSWQVGSGNDYMPVNQTKAEGNDDQSTWALAAMTAAEQGFPSPSVEGSSNLTWAQLAENVFNEQAARWDQQTCGGGVRWQIFTFNAGYSYKNSLTNGNFYQLAARLALYTGNSTYSDWAQRVLAWSTQSGLISNETGAVYDGFDTATNCSQANHIQWTSSTGTYLSGASYLQNYSSILRNSAPPFFFFVSLNKTFTENHVLYESACATSNNCNTDQLAFKAIGSRALARARDLTFRSAVTVNGTAAGTLQENINAVIQASAQGAAAQCSGGDTGSVCGSDWLNGTWDGTQGLGQDISALEIILATLPGKELRNANSSSTTSSGGNSTATGNGGSSTGTSQPSASVLASNDGTKTISGSLVSAVTVAVGLAIAIGLFM